MVAPRVVTLHLLPPQLLMGMPRLVRCLFIYLFVCLFVLAPAAAGDGCLMADAVLTLLLFLLLLLLLGVLVLYEGRGKNRS